MVLIFRLAPFRDRELFHTLIFFVFYLWKSLSRYLSRTFFLSLFISFFPLCPISALPPLHALLNLPLFLSHFLSLSLCLYLFYPFSPHLSPLMLHYTLKGQDKRLIFFLFCAITTNIINLI